MIASVGGMSQINDKLFAITVVDANTITLQGTDGTAFSATSGGTLTSGTFTPSTPPPPPRPDRRQHLATDQWGATGVAAHSTAMPTFPHGLRPKRVWHKRLEKIHQSGAGVRPPVVMAGR